jgi:hypothetical protein
MQLLRSFGGKIMAVRFTTKVWPYVMMVVAVVFIAVVAYLSTR